MITLFELTGVKLRKDLNATRVRMTYHNKHKNGSGNFGFVVVYAHEGTKDAGCGMTVPNEDWFSLSGNYNTIKQIWGLTFGDYSRPIIAIPQDWSYESLLDYAKRFIEEQKKIKESDRT